MSVCLSDCPPHDGIVLKQRKLKSHNLHRRITPGLCSLLHKVQPEIRQGSPLGTALNEWDRKNFQFPAFQSPYLRKGARKNQGCLWAVFTAIWRVVPSNIVSNRAPVPSPPREREIWRLEPAVKIWIANCGQTVTVIVMVTRLYTVDNIGNQKRSIQRYRHRPHTTCHSPKWGPTGPQLVILFNKRIWWWWWWWRWCLLSYDDYQTSISWCTAACFYSNPHNTAPSSNIAFHYTRRIYLHWHIITQ